MRHLVRPLTLALLTGALLASGCSDDDESPVRPIDEGVSFDVDVQPIFDLRCAAVCHVGPLPNGDLDLSAGNSFANLVDVPATGYANQIRVVPGDPNASLLFQKLIGDQFGNRMPLNGALPDSQITTIRTWIEDGARGD